MTWMGADFRGATPLGVTAYASICWGIPVVLVWYTPVFAFIFDTFRSFCHLALATFLFRSEIENMWPECADQSFILNPSVSFLTNPTLARASVSSPGLPHHPTIASISCAE